jgi:hypothetical protein
VVSCSTTKVSKPPIEIKNNIILQDGFSLGSFASSIHYKFQIEMKSEKDFAIKQIDYDLRIPSYNKLIQGTMITDMPITLNSNFGYKTFSFKSESFSYSELCNQLEAMFKITEDVFSLRMDLTLYTSDNQKIVIKDVEFKFNNSTIWAKIRNLIAEKGCNVMNIITNIKDLIKL